MIDETEVFEQQCEDCGTGTGVACNPLVPHPHGGRIWLTGDTYQRIGGSLVTYCRHGCDVAVSCPRCSDEAEPLLSWDELLERDAPDVDRAASGLGGPVDLKEIAAGTFAMPGPHLSYALPRLAAPPSGRTLLLTVSLYWAPAPLVPHPPIVVTTGLGLSWASMTSTETREAWLGSWRAVGLIGWSELAIPLIVTVDRACSKMAYKLVEVGT